MITVLYTTNVNQRIWGTLFSDKSFRFVRIWSIPLGIGGTPCSPHGESGEANASFHKDRYFFLVIGKTVSLLGHITVPSLGSAG